MKIRSAVVATVLLLSCSGLYAQSSHDIETKYEKSDVYSVSENLWMTPAFDSQGQVCQMRVYAKAVAKNVNYLVSDLSIDETLKFINDLFPVETRGRRGEWFGLSLLTGGFSFTGFHYENVHFVFISSLRRTKLPKKLDTTNIYPDFPVDDPAESLDYHRKQEKKSDDQQIREHVHGARILDIQWTNRKCVKP